MPDKPSGGLDDKTIRPSDGQLASLTGGNFEFWKTILQSATGNWTDLAGDWHYYNDGGQWLYRFMRKKKTVFWASVAGGTFRITFYLTAKASPLIEASDLPERVINAFRSYTGKGVLIPVTINISEQNDIAVVLSLISLKLKMK